MINDDDVSFNFNIAKVLSILMVATGHFFSKTFYWIWIPVTFALFIFAFSSGYFTAKKYQKNFSKLKFWETKIIRLFVPIIIIDSFLLFIFIIQHQNGIFTWQTIISLFGLNGFLAWFKLGNPSPFGIGLWFFTVLIMFYIIYPIINYINKDKYNAFFFLALIFISTSFFHFKIPMTHSLWITVFSFILGCYVGKYSIKISSLLSLFIFLVSCILLFILNIILNFNHINYFLILFASLSLIGILLSIKFSSIIILNKILILSNCLIQIYFIHPYLINISFTNNIIINYIVYIIILLIISIFLKIITNKIQILLNNTLTISND